MVPLQKGFFIIIIKKANTQKQISQEHKFPPHPRRIFLQILYFLKFCFVNTMQICEVFKL